MSLFKIEFRGGGVFLPNLGLWLDSHEARAEGLVFVSHAHSDHTAAHREVIVSAPTSRLMRSRQSGEWVEHVLPYHQPWNLPPGTGRITLLPAGHIFGSAMASVEAESETLLYTGDFKLRPGLSSEPCAPRPADILIMETTYGRPQYRFPPTADVLRGVIRFCHEALDNEETPVLLGYSLGKSQELLCGLAEAGLPIMLHQSVYRLTKIYEDFGHSFPAYSLFQAAEAKGQVLLCPPGAAGAALLRTVGRPRIAVLTGWAVDPSCRFRYQAHAAFPLSDHADFPDLLELVRQVAPKKVLTLHGFAADFAQTLRDEGYDAQALSEDEQLSLPLRLTRSSAPRRASLSAPDRLKALEALAPAPADPAVPTAETFWAFAEMCARIATLPKKLEKSALLAGYLASLSPAALGIATVWFSGNPFAPSQNKSLQLGWALIRDGLCAVAGVDQASFGQVYLKHSDLGEAAFEMMETAAARTGAVFSIEGMDQMFHQLLAARGSTAKLPVLEGILHRLTPLEAKFLVKILTGDLRIGLKEGLVEEAVAKAFNAPLDQVKHVHLLVGNIGETAVLASRHHLPAVTLLPFRPVKYMLAAPEPAAADIWKRVEHWRSPAGPSPDLPLPNLDLPLPSTAAWVEDKYDGIRAQIHKVGGTVAIYSRDLKEITTGFEELAEAARTRADDFIADGEIVAMRDEKVLPYAELQRRLGRRETDLFLRDQIPARFVAFDLLWRNGESLIDQPLASRRAHLEMVAGGAFHLAQITRVGSEEEIEQAFHAARARHNEGLMIKDPASRYTPGRRGLSWLKLKKAGATLDCVVIGAEYGHGKRRAVLSDYTFAVRDEASGELKTIGKAYSGLTDTEIARLTERFLGQVLWQRGRYFAVEPNVVLEIAFDLLQPSPRHESGLAMRFPRIVRIRTDKTAAEADTLATARRLAGLAEPGASAVLMGARVSSGRRRRAS